VLRTRLLTNASEVLNSGDFMITLKNKETGEFIGTISEADLQYLIDELEEENSEDKDYWLNKGQLEILADKGANPALIAMIESALGENRGVEIIWERS
jgi:RimJ/RimL family protein N-acetyltransferase